MPDYVVQRVTALLNQQGRAVRDTKVLLLGIAYKAATSDWRESPSIVVAERLAALGARLSACDPHIKPALADRVPVPLVDYGATALTEAELVIVLVDHPEFSAEEIARLAPLVLDTKGLLRGHAFVG